MKEPEIIDKSVALINGLGYHEVSLEVLLDKLKIRISDFNRNFSDIDDLIEKVFFQLCKESDDLSSDIDHASTSLEKLYVTTIKSYELQVKYRFIFHNLIAIMDKHEKIKDRYFELIALRKAQLIHLFSLLCSEDVFRDENYTGSFENLSNQMTMLSDYWITHNHIIFGKGNYQHQYYGKLIFSLVLPYLTEKGLELYRTILGYKGDPLRKY